MENGKCSDSASRKTLNPEYEIAEIRKTGNSCPLCESYASDHASKPIAVMSCEGACLRGEIARQAANIICHRLIPDKTVRICLGGAFTKDTGQRNLVRKATELIALEGCFIECASRMMSGVIPGLAPRVIVTDSLCDFDRNLFGTDQLAEDEIKTLAMTVAQQVVGRL
jgi:hypothetical protein